MKKEKTKIIPFPKKNINNKSICINCKEKICIEGLFCCDDCYEEILESLSNKIENVLDCTENLLFKEDAYKITVHKLILFMNKY